MENIDKIKCVLIDFEQNEKTLDEAANEILLLFSVSGSSPDDFWKQEYDEAVKEIGNLQDQLKDAESELRSRY